MNTIKNIKEGIQSLKDKEALVEIMEAVNNRVSYLEMLEEANKLSNSSFGYIKESFEMISPDLYKSDNGKKIINKYISTIKENSALKEMYGIFENVYHSSNNADAEYMVNEAFETPINKQELVKGTSNLGMILAEGYLYLNGKCTLPSDINTELNESINYLATSKKSMANLSERSEKRNMVLNYIVENKGKNTRKKTGQSADIESMVESFNKKYSTGEFAEIYNEVKTNQNHAELFESYKNNCLSIIKETMDANPNNVAIERLERVYEGVKNKAYNEETLLSDLVNFNDLKEIVKE